MIETASFRILSPKANECSRGWALSLLDRKTMQQEKEKEKDRKKLIAVTVYRHQQEHTHLNTESVATGSVDEINAESTRMSLVLRIVSE
jgi:hypothetical protein